MKKYINSIIPLFVTLILIVTSCDTDTKIGDRAVLVDKLPLADATLEYGYTYLHQALVITELDGVLNGEGEFTLFAPTNDAFVAFLAENGYSSLNDIPVETLSNVLRYHVLGAKKSSDALGRREETLLTGQILNVVAGASNLNGKAAISDADQFYENGILHEISRVVLPPAGDAYSFISNDTSYSTLKTAVDHAGLQDLFQGSDLLTIFAPMNDAFAAVGLTPDVIVTLPSEDVAEVVAYHALSGMTFSTEVPNSRIFTLAGSADDGKQGLDFTSDGISVSINTYITSSVNTPNLLTTNAAVHQVTDVVFPDEYLPDYMLIGNNAGLISYYASNTFAQGINTVDTIRARFLSEDRYHLLSPTNYALEVYFADEGISGWGDLSNEQINTIVDMHTFDKDLSITDSEGDSIKNKLGERWFVTVNNDGAMLNGTLGVDGFATSGGEFFINPFGDFDNPNLDRFVYNGTLTSITRILGDIPTIPNESIGEVLLNTTTHDLFGAAIVKTEILSSSSLYTVFAVDNSNFPFSFATAQDILDLDPANPDDAEAIDDLADYIQDQTIAGLEFFVDLTVDLPDNEVISGNGTIRWSISGGLVGVDESRNPLESASIDVPDLIANNGIVHGVDRSFMWE